METKNCRDEKKLAFILYSWYICYS